MWDDSYLITTREFGVADETIYGIGVYGLERARMIAGDPGARAVSFLLQDGRVPLEQIGDGLLPPDIDGRRLPRRNAAAPIVGTQDDDAAYGATVDALNIWEFNVTWGTAPTASIGLTTQIPVAEFDSIFPCAPTARDCLPQPGITNPDQFLDVLSYRQRPDLAARVPQLRHARVLRHQPVGRGASRAGRHPVVRDPCASNGRYVLRQQGTYAPDDGIHRWMGSIAQDKLGNLALGYSVVNGVDVFPGIRYTGRRFFDPRGPDDPRRGHRRQRHRGADEPQLAVG